MFVSVSVSEMYNQRKRVCCGRPSKLCKIQPVKDNFDQKLLGQMNAEKRQASSSEMITVQERQDNLIYQ